MTRQRVFGAKDTDLFFFVLVGSFNFFIDEDSMTVSFGRPRESKSSSEGEEARKLVGMALTLLMWRFMLRELRRRTLMNQNDVGGKEWENFHAPAAWIVLFGL